MKCIFCSIAAGDVPANVVHADDQIVAFLDTAPLLHGHTLVIPREHTDTLDELRRDLMTPLLSVVQRVSRAQQKVLGAQGSFTSVNTRVSQSVPHLHVHVVPRREGDGLFARGMVWMRKRYAEGQAEEIARKLREALAQP